MTAEFSAICAAMSGGECWCACWHTLHVSASQGDSFCFDQVNDKGDGYQFIAIATQNVFKTAESIKKANAPVLQDVGYFPGTTILSIVTQDPSGWKYVFFSEEDYIKDIQYRQHIH